ncbi:oligosaccharide flippase family protein [Dyella silvatica]|uniref:oligosaccharide flippase family protein n=1 Tax=Dyella silvatica TaxID=2992128 RepID=UPI00225A8F84|nr:oligosaccharide flippase family protein [Dyella silvatica]
MPLREKIARFRQGGLIGSITLLVGGTAFAQALMVLVLPILTRLYSPQDFSVLAVYASLLGIISVAACLRLDIAIPMPETDGDAINLLALALSFCLLISMLVALPILLAPVAVAALLRQPELQPYLWLLPIGVLLTGAYSALQYWATRKKIFGVIAKTRMTQAIGGAGAQLGMGWLGFVPSGLLVGQAITSGAGVVGLGARVLTVDRAALGAVSLPGMRRLFRQYDRFPKYSTFEALANTGGIQLPVIMIAALAVGAEAGFLMLAMRVIQVPMNLIGNAISQVYLAHAPEEYRAGTLGGFTAKILGGLMKTGVGPLLFAALVAPQAFVLIFGEKWQRAGVLVAWMTPWFIAQLMSSPVSMVMHVRNKQRGMMLLTIAGLCLRVGAIGAAALLLPSRLSELYAVSGAVFYLACFFIFSNLAGLTRQDYRQLLRSGLNFVLLWLALGLVVRFALHRLI